MRTVSDLSLPRQLAYACGSLGSGLLYFVVNIQLVFFYLPPDNVGLPTLIGSVAIFGIFNAITLIAASGRILDAISDPIVANYSDRATFRRGRRIPFMAAGAAPAALFCWLMFTPPSMQPGLLNIIWLLGMQALFFTFVTVYSIPYIALLPELGHTSLQRLNLSTWLSIFAAIGIIGAAQTPALAAALDGWLGIGDKLTAWQAAIGLTCLFALVMMLAPVLAIDERRYAVRRSATAPMWSAMGSTFRNRNFRPFVVAVTAYYIGLTVVNTGLLFYITVLLGQDEALVGPLLTLMVIGAFVLYPFVNMLARRSSKKGMVVAASLWQALVFLLIASLGRLPLPAVAQGYLLALAFAVPVAVLGVLANAVLADIAHHDSLESGESREGMFFATRTLMQKFGQTLGIVLFAALAILGKDVGNDWGIRLSALAGFVLSVAGALLFARYDEASVLRETAEMEELKRENA